MWLLCLCLLHLFAAAVGKGNKFGIAYVFVSVIHFAILSAFCELLFCFYQEEIGRCGGVDDFDLGDAELEAREGGEIFLDHLAFGVAFGIFLTSANVFGCPVPSPFTSLAVSL